MSPETAICFPLFGSTIFIAGFLEATISLLYRLVCLNKIYFEDYLEVLGIFSWLAVIHLLPLPFGEYHYDVVRYVICIFFLR
jgi:hypothetical protein